MRALALLVLMALAGCADPAYITDADRPDGIWMTQTHGCGWCGPTDAAWADTIVVYGDEDPFWFSFRPETGMEGDDIGGIEIPPELAHHRVRIEEALALLQETGSYYARGEDFRIYEARSVPWSLQDRAAFEAEVAGHLPDEAPPTYEYDCTDYGFPHVTVMRPTGLHHGSVPETDDHCMRAMPAGGSSWSALSATLGDLRRQAQPS